MPSPALIATQLTTPVTRPISVFGGGRDVTSLILAEGFEIEDAGASQGGLSVTLNETLANLPELTDQSFVRVFDETSATEMFRGFTKSRRPVLVPTWTRTEIRATDHGALLDTYIPGPESRPAESDAARIGYFWGLFASPYLSGDLSSVAVVNASLPAQIFQGVTLRRALDMIAAEASDWYLDQTGHLHYFSSETNAAPKNITSDTPAGDEVAPLDLEIDYDTMTYANAVYINGQNATGSGWYRDDAEIARVGTVVTGDPLDAPDCSTSTMRVALGAMYLGRVAGGLPRGRFTVTSEDADGWRAGQTLDVRSADVGIDQNFRLSRVRTTQLKPSTYQYEVEFGGSRRGSGGSGDSGDDAGMPGGPLVYGELGGSSNTYVTSDGVTVTDGA
jgi:hypothetical protein